MKKKSLVLGLILISALGSFKEARPGIKTNIAIGTAAVVLLARQVPSVGKAIGVTSMIAGLTGLGYTTYLTNNFLKTHDDIGIWFYIFAIPALLVASLTALIGGASAYSLSQQ